MTVQLTDSRRANLGASAIRAAFDAYCCQFKAITRRAATRFERCDWHGMQADAAERLDLYTQIIDRIVAEICELLGARLHDPLLWVSIKAVYSGLIATRDDWELAETFFNSLTRRIFTTVGVNPQIEFVHTDFETPLTSASRPVYRSYERAPSTAALVERILDDYRFAVDYQDLARDAQLVAAAIDKQLQAIGAPALERAELIEARFFRGKSAYLVGRLLVGGQMLPLALALLNTPHGVVVDAVLLDERAISILFSFTRSYFHVDIDRPYDLVMFLKSIMPWKRVAELYIAIGHHKHGKTELFRDILHHLSSTDDSFEIARGERGMVMAVFSLRDANLVFKVIKDRFAAPKDTSREAVMGKYHLVFRHDRAGRLVDAQEFEHLRFERRRFSPALLEELQCVANQTVLVEGDMVVIRHVYIERQVTPLNLYVREAEPELAAAAVVDYGQAIKDLAASGIFPGDLLLKNFGVTRQGRVVFYDYDELCALSSCVFRALPQPSSDDEEMAAEPWFFVGEHDIFPEELQRFLGLQGALREHFMRHHVDLFDVGFWHTIQARLAAGEVLDIFPYERNRRLQRERP